MNGILDLTPGSWALDVAAWAALMTGLGVIARSVWGFIRVIGRVADGVEKLNALLEGDVLVRLDEGSRLIADLTARVEKHDYTLLDHAERLAELERGR